MLEESCETYLERRKKEISQDDSIPVYLKQSQIAEIHLGVGKHAESLFFFERALVM
jgi:hypothetical protein